MRVQVFVLGLAAGLTLSESTRNVRDDGRPREQKTEASIKLTRSFLDGQGYGNFSTRFTGDNDRSTRVASTLISRPRPNMQDTSSDGPVSSEQPRKTPDMIVSASAISTSDPLRPSTGATSVPRSVLSTSAGSTSQRPTGRPRISRPTKVPTNLPTTLRKTPKLSRTRSSKSHTVRPTTPPRPSSRSRVGVPGISVLSKMMASVVNIVMHSNVTTVTKNRPSRTSAFSQTGELKPSSSISSRFSQRDLPGTIPTSAVSVFSTPVSSLGPSVPSTRLITVIGVPVATVCPRQISSNPPAFAPLSPPTPTSNSTISSSPAPTIRPFVNFARLLVGPDGCQTLYAPSSSPTSSICSTVVTPLGLPPVTVSRCNQYVTFSSETAFTCTPTSSFVPMTRRGAEAQTTQSFSYAILPNEPEYGTPPPPPPTNSLTTMVDGRGSSQSAATSISIKPRAADLQQVEEIPEVIVPGANLKRDGLADLHQVNTVPEVRIVGANLKREVLMDFHQVENAPEVKIAGGNLKRDTAADLHVVNGRPAVHISGANLKREALPDPVMGEVKPGIFVAPAASVVLVTTVTVPNTATAVSTSSVASVYLNITEQVSRLLDPPNQLSNKLANAAQFSPPQATIYYAAPFAEVARAGVPTHVREIKCSGGVIPEPTDPARCQTTTELWSLSSFNLTSYVARTVSFSGPVVFSTADYTTTTTIQFSSVTTSTRFVPTGMVVRSTLSSDGPTVTVPITSPATTSTIVLDRLSTSIASSSIDGEGTTTFTTSTVVETVTIPGSSTAVAMDLSRDTPAVSGLPSDPKTPVEGLAGLNEPGATLGYVPILP